MKKILCVLSLYFCSLNMAVAADQGELEAAEELLAAVGMEQVLEQSISQMIDMQLQQKPALAPYRNVMEAFFNKHMSYESLKPEMAALYAEYFTEQELRDLIGFYETPTGQKAVAVMPELMGRGAQIGVARVQANLGELKQMIQAESAKLGGAQSQ